MKAWLCTILKNVVYSEHRKNKTRERHATSYRATASTSFEISETEAAYELREILKYLQSLPEGKVDAFIAVACLGMEYAEVATRFGCPDGTIKSQVSRRRKMLKAFMNGTESNPLER